MAEPDDEALHWSEPADPSHLGAPEDGPGAGVEAGVASRVAQTSSAVLIGYGIFAGIYLLFTVAWIISAMRNTGGVESAFGDFMYTLGQFLAVAASALWLVVTLLLTRNRQAAVRLLWLLIGVLVLVPWPFVLGV